MLFLIALQSRRILGAFLLLFSVVVLHADPVNVAASVTGKGVVLGTGTFEAGTQITLHAAPQVDWRFDRWEGVPNELAQNNPITLQAAADLHPTAVMTFSTGAGRFAGAPVIAAGDNRYGTTNVPTGLDSAIAVSAGGGTAAALKNDGTVVAWGVNDFGQTNVPIGLNQVIAIDAGSFHHLALKQDRTVVAWGRNDDGQATVPVCLTNVYAVAAGRHHSLALKQDGMVAAWGRNNLGQSTVPAGLRGVVAIAAGEFYSLALKADGSVTAWGAIHHPSGNTPPAVPPASFTDLIAISASYNYNLGLKANGIVVQWGLLAGDASGMPSGLTDVGAVAAGSECGLVIKEDRTLVWWLRLGAPSPDPLSDIIAADAASSSIVALQGSGFGLIREALSSIFLEEGEFFRLAPVVVGGQSYQWFRNGQPVSGATSQNLVISSSQGSDAGAYQLAVIKGADVFATPPTQVGVVPAGYPRVLVNGAEVRDAIRLSGQAQITLTTTLSEPQIFYTLDGSTPTFSSTRYTAPFTLVQPTNVTVRALAISGDFTKEITNTPVTVQVAPSYTLTILISGPGRVEKTPNLTHYLEGDTVRLQANPNVDAHFVRWENQLTGTDPNREIVMNSDWTIEAVFENDPEYSPTISSGGGTVTQSPPGPHLAGSDVLLTATPQTGWTFLGWTGDHTGPEPSFTWHVTGPASFNANFGTPVTTTVSGAGQIVLEPALALYPYGTQVKVTPVADAGNYLALWGMDGAGQPLAEWTLTVTNAQPKISALFRPLEIPIDVTQARIESGQLKFRATGTAGTTAIIQSSPDFINWTDGATITLQAGGSDETVPIVAGDKHRFIRLKQTP